MATGKRDAVLTAALELFAEHTFAGTPVPTIAARAGVGAGTIYRYFTDKEDLGNAVYRLWLGRLHTCLTDSPPATSTRDELGQWWRALVGFGLDEPAAFTFLERQQHDDYLDEESITLADAVEGVVLGLVRRGQRRGEVRKADARLLASLLTGAATGLIQAAAAGELRLTRRAADDAEAAAWALVAA